MINALMGISLVPIIVLNIFGSITGAIWLFIIGEWQLVLIGFLADVVFTFAYPLIMIVQMPLALLMKYLADKNKATLAMFPALVNMLIVTGINLTWVILTFSILTGFSESTSVIPYLLFGWGIGTGPFQYMASKEPPDSTATYAAVYLTQISYLVLVVTYLLHVLWLALPLIIIIAAVIVIYLMKAGHTILKNRSSLAT